MSSRPFDVILYGASGYTGRWILEELLGARRKDETIALAGRSEARIRAAIAGHSPALTSLLSDYCREQKLEKIPVFECDSSDSSSLVKMTANAVVVISAAGPFNQVGMPVVDACVATGTSYCDITGEPLFVERCYVTHHEAAKKKNIAIVNCCGFDCIPTDLSVMQIRKQVPNVSKIEGFLRSNAHGNVGTLFTAVDGIKSAAVLRKLRASSPRPPLSLSFKPKSMFRHPRLGYCIQFPGADPTICRNSQIERKTLSGINPIPIGLYFSANSILVFLALIWIGIVIFLASRFSFFERILRSYPGFLTFGVFSNEPAPESLKSKYAEWTFLFETSDGKSGEAVMRLTDPGYSATATCSVGAALSIVREPKKVVSGVVTSATAFEKTGIFEHLQSRGVVFKISQK